MAVVVAPAFVVVRFACAPAGTGFWGATRAAALARLAAPARVAARVRLVAASLLPGAVFLVPVLFVGG